MEIAFAPSSFAVKTHQQTVSKRMHRCVRMASHQDASRARFAVIADRCAKRAEQDVKQIGKFVAAGALAAYLATADVQSVCAEVPDDLPSKFFLDDANVVQKSNGGYIEKALSTLEQRTGFKVHFVITRNLPTLEGDPRLYAEEVFKQWGCDSKDVVVVAGTKLAKAGIFAGSDAAKVLTPEIALSIGTETFPFKAGDEQYSAAVGDTSRRLVDVLDGKPDPGPPEIIRESGEGTFKSRSKTSKGRNKYATVIVALLVASAVIPMLQYWWYVKDD